MQANQSTYDLDEGKAGVDREKTMNSALITYNEARARADQMRDGEARPANRPQFAKRAKPTQLANVNVEECHQDGDLWSGESRGRYQIHRRMKRHLRFTLLRLGRSLLTIIRSPIAIQRWLVVLFIIAALSTVIVDGISLSMGFSNLLEREVLVP